MNQETRRELNKRQCRNRILKASRRLFRDRGYDSVTMDDVARQAEVSRATLYNYFPSKESLLLGIADAELEVIQTLIDEELAAEPRYLRKLWKVLDVLIYDTISYLALSRRITYLNSCEGSPLYASRLGTLKILRSLVLGAQQQGDLRADVPADDIVDVVMALYLMAQFEWTHIAEYSQEVCSRKLRRYFESMLCSFFTEQAETL